MVKDRALEHINDVWIVNGWGTSFDHSFCISGASFYLASKVDPEIVHLAGQWKSLAYQTYIRAFKQIVSVHMGDISHSVDILSKAVPWVG
jgi:hypothetical protein